MRYGIFSKVSNNVWTAILLAPSRRSAIPPTDGTMRSKAALPSLLKISRSSYKCICRRMRFISIASWEDRLGREPHWSGEAKCLSSALWISLRPNMIRNIMFRSATTINWILTLIFVEVGCAFSFSNITWWAFNHLLSVKINSKGMDITVEETW
jgi:hypothetical protein